MTIWAVYIITNKANAKQYVGITKDLKRRWHQHLSANGSAPAIHAAIQKYGKDGFVFSHICDAFDFEAACDIERMLIQQHNTLTPNGYNMTVGGQIGPVGYKHSAETKAKLAEANRNRNPEVKEKFRLAKKGVKQTEAFRANASAKMKEVWAKRRSAKEQAVRLLTNIKSLENCHGQ